MLQNQYYLGQVAYKGQWFTGQHPPLIDQLLFNQCQTVRAARRSRADSANRTTRIYPRSGLLYCRECGIRYRGYGKAGPQPQYYYQPAKSYDVRCSQRPTVHVDQVEADLVDVISQIQIPATWREQITEYLGELAQPALDGEQQLAHLNGRLNRAKNLYLAGDLTDSQYAFEKGDIQRQIDDLRARLDKSPAFDYAPAVETLNNFGELYRLADQEKEKDSFKLCLKESTF